MSPNVLSAFFFVCLFSGETKQCLNAFYSQYFLMDSFLATKEKVWYAFKDMLEVKKKSCRQCAAQVQSLVRAAEEANGERRWRNATAGCTLAGVFKMTYQAFCSSNEPTAYSYCITSLHLLNLAQKPGYLNQYWPVWNYCIYGTLFGGLEKPMIKEKQ